jgi:hypothetical protein
MPSTKNELVAQFLFSVAPSPVKKKKLSEEKVKSESLSQKLLAKVKTEMKDIKSEKEVKKDKIETTSSDKEKKDTSSVKEKQDTGSEKERKAGSEKIKKTRSKRRKERGKEGR